MGLLRSPVSPKPHTVCSLVLWICDVYLCFVVLCCIEYCSFKNTMQCNRAWQNKDTHYNIITNIVNPFCSVLLYSVVLLLCLVSFALCGCFSSVNSRSAEVFREWYLPPSNVASHLRPCPTMHCSSWHRCSDADAWSVVTVSTIWILILSVGLQLRPAETSCSAVLASSLV